MPRTYKVETCWGHPDHLEDLVKAIGNDGGRIVSVTWNPDCTIKDGARTTALDSKYVIVSEYNTDAQRT
jgi:hypothetical protein